MSFTAVAVMEALASKLPLELYKALKQLASSNSHAVDVEFREAMDAMTAAMASRYDWNSFPEDERPTVDDAKNVAREFNDEYERASGNPKRKLLFSALFGYFNPKFYRAGMSKILWDYVAKMEYPDAVFLRNLIAKVENQVAKHGSGARFSEDNSHRNWVVTEFPIGVDSVDFEMAVRSSHMGLGTLRQTEDQSVVYITPHRGLVNELLEFVWDGKVDSNSPHSSGGPEELA